MPNLDRAYELFRHAFSKIQAGSLFDDGINTEFEYTLKSIWNSQYQRIIRNELLKYLPHIFQNLQHQENLPPFIYILITLKDTRINIRLQELAIADWIQNNGDEPSTFILLHLLDSFVQKGTDIKNFANATIKYMNEEMDREMIKAFSYMLISAHPEFLNTVLKKMAKFKDREILKDFIQMVGRKAVIELMGILKPGEVQKMLGK